MSTVITEFSAPDHLEDVVDVLLRVRESDSQYPPPADAGYGRDSISQWLLADPAVARWVALNDCGVVGHVQVSEAHAYLRKIPELQDEKCAGKSKLAEIGKFFVDPACQRSGVGALLFDRARAFARSLDSVAVLAVVETSEKAVAFYEDHEMHLVTTFQGVHGTNLVYVDGRM